MTTDTAMDDTTLLMAYADGELPREQAAEIEARLVHDAEARRLVALFLTDRQRLTGLVDAAAQDRDGGRSTAAGPAQGDGRGAAPVDGPAARVARARRRPARVPGAGRLMPRALAASVVAGLVGLGTAGGFLAGRLGDGGGGGGPAHLAALSGAPSPMLIDALETLPNGAVRDWSDRGGEVVGTITPTVTYVAEDGRFCREVEQVVDSPAIPAPVTAYGIACREGDGWQVRYWIIETSDAPDPTRS
ncbi:MAG: hypothetical protein RID91_02405 [Azospirillaceae bacterium]